jgi:cytoskeletal protein RodZ
MPRIPVCVLLLMSAALAFGLQQQNQGQNPPSANPQSSPDTQQSPRQAAPNPQDKAAANSQMQSDIQSSLSSDPVLSGTDVQVNVDDMNITLTGSVRSQAQLDRVAALVSPYIRYRNVVNKVIAR